MDQSGVIRFSIEGPATEVHLPVGATIEDNEAQVIKALRLVSAKQATYFGDGNSKYGTLGELNGAFDDMNLRTDGLINCYTFRLVIAEDGQSYTCTADPSLPGTQR